MITHLFLTLRLFSRTHAMMVFGENPRYRLLAVFQVFILWICPISGWVIDPLELSNYFEQHVTKFPLWCFAYY